MTPAEIAAAPWWRWEARLWAVTRHGNRILLPYHNSAEADEVLRGMGAVPDLADPFLPWWLLQLLRERTGPGTHVHPDVVAGGGWDVWDDRAKPGEHAVWRCLGSGPTEIGALLAALQGVGS